jgi:hypothetical protein
MSWIGDEILALRTLFQGDELYLAPSREQVHGLRNAVTKVIPEEARIPVMQLVTGLTLLDTATGECTTKTMTRYTFSVLIDNWMEKNGGDEIVSPWKITGYYAGFLKECQKIVEDGAGLEPWAVDPRGL